MQEFLFGFLAGTVTFAAGFFTIRKFAGWLFPIKIEPNVTRQYSNDKPDQIGAVIVNRSREPVYVVKCGARSAKPLKQAIISHLRRPFTRPKLIPTIYFGTHTYEMTCEKSIKLEPDEPLFLCRDMVFANPIFMLHTTMVAIEVELSSGRKVRSSRIDVPESWTLQKHLATQPEVSGET